MRNNTRHDRKSLRRIVRFVYTVVLTHTHPTPENPDRRLALGCRAQPSAA
jgi:hypothetical protein